MKIIKLSLIIILLTAINPIGVFAHQPNYIGQQSEINNYEPDISKAYYGRLNGSKTIYNIQTNTSLNLYVQILSPKIENPKKDFNVLIIDNNEKIIADLSMPPNEWKDWYEEYGGDWYWQGPSLKQNVPAGFYKIIVSNPDNYGKYSLAIGEVESFPINQMIHTIKELYIVKTKFFNEPWYGIFYGIIGKYLLISFVIILIIIISSLWLIFHKNHKNKALKQ